jgi:hypothetical protein
MNKFLFELTRPQSNSIITIVFTKKFGEYKEGKFSLDFKKLELLGFDGFLKVLNGNCENTTYEFSGGMDLGAHVNKRYAWDKEQVICNQPIKYYCSKGWFGSVIAFTKDWVNREIKKIKVGV